METKHINFENRRSVIENYWVSTEIQLSRKRNKIMSQRIADKNVFKIKDLTSTTNATTTTVRQHSELRQDF